METTPTAAPQRTAMEAEPRLTQNCRTANKLKWLSDFLSCAVRARDRESATKKKKKKKNK